MLRVIIADDEPVIVRGLRKLIPWEDYGMTIVDEARDGGELWEKVVSQRPDIVVSDISMPAMTGLQFMKRLQQEQPGTQVVFISGYQRFEYVQEAIRLGAVDYILKPVLRKALAEAVKKARLRFQNQERLDMLQTDRDGMQEFSEILCSGNRCVPEDLCRTFYERAGIEYRRKSMACVCFYIDERSKRRLETENYRKMELLRFSCLNRVRKFLTDRGIGAAVRRDEECIYLLCAVAPGEREDFLESAVGAAVEQAEREAGSGLSLRAGVSAFSDRPDELAYLYQSSKFAYEMRYFMDQKIICADHVHQQFAHSFEEYDQLRKKILDGLVTRRPDVARDFEELIGLIRSLHYGNRYAMVNRCILFAGSLYDDLRAYGGEPDEEAQLQFMEQIRTAVDFRELREEFLAYYNGLCGQISAQAAMWDNPAIARVVDYMRLHYDTDINMYNMAELACVNPVYFGSLFKKTTGQNFKSFLTDIRMEEARRLVITTDMKTYAVAEKVGYPNSRQFTGKFREYYGSSPSEYRRQLGGQEKGK